MEETLGRALPQRISNDLDEFLASPIPAIIDCSNCVTNIPGKESIVHRPCEQTLATRCHATIPGGFLDGQQATSGEARCRTRGR